MAITRSKFLKFPGNRLIGLLVIVAMLSACVKVKKVKNEQGETEVVADLGEGPTRGEISIGVDESMNPVLEQELQTFMMLYPKAKLNPRVEPEGALIEQLLNDSLRLILIGRRLTEAELKQIRKAQIVPRETEVGTGAVALINHPDNPVDGLTEDDLGRILRGEIRNWKALGGEDAPIDLVFDHPRSGVLQMARDRFMKEGDSLPPNAYTAGGTAKVIDYVYQAKNALGLIGYAWIADRDSPDVKQYLQKVNLMRMMSPEDSDMPGAWVRPYQSEIKLGRWPLTRSIFAVSREHFSGLGTGFVVFLAGEQGQSILLKAGLVAEFPPPREVIMPPLDKDN